MASRYEAFLAAGVRIVAIDVDGPSQHAAMIEKLSLPFPMLSDPDRSLAIEPFGVADPKDPRQIARPSMVLIDRNGEERWRFVSRDFADRLPEEAVLDQARSLDDGPTDPEDMTIGPAEPGPRAMPSEDLRSYLRGARFAALAMGLRHGHHAESIKEDSKAYVAEMDRYLEALHEMGL